MAAILVWTRLLTALVAAAALTLLGVLVYRMLEGHPLPAEALRPQNAHEGVRGWCAEGRTEVPLQSEPPFPVSLSDWCLFQSRDGVLQLSPRVVPYAVSSPHSADYAHSFRTLWIPPGSRMDCSRDGDIELPQGAILTQTLYYPLELDGTPARDAVLLQDPLIGEEGNWHPPFLGERLMETRMLVRGAATWYPLTYVWNAAQTSAILESSGATIPQVVADSSGQMHVFSYDVPTVFECMECHKDRKKMQDGISPIGLVARQINRSFRTPDGEENQLERWSRLELLRSLPPLDALPLAVAWNDTEAESLEARAIAWLASQCGYCHASGGAAEPSGLLLDVAHRHSVAGGLCLPVSGSRRVSGGHRYVIDPGAPERSLLLARLTTAEPAHRMPPLGARLPDLDGAALIETWISLLPGRCEAP